jgi:spore coat protein A
MALEKYVDKLPIPPVLAPVSSDNGVDYYEVTMKEITQKLHRDLNPTTLYAYEGIYPGPTFVTESNTPIKVKWINDLPVSPHLLPVDKTLHGAEGVPEVRTVVHLHGANVQPDSDGFPEAWFINNFQEVGPAFTNEVYYYPNKQPATTLFYHDHALGITRLNVYAGLAGAYLIRDEIEENLNLPKGEFEIPLIIQDRTFNSDGSLFYPSQPEDVIPGLTPDPSVVPEFFGDTILVNGKVWPYLEVRPQRYRFRIVNGSNSRFYNIKLENTSVGQTPLWLQIGTDGGFLEAPVTLTNLTLAPGERADTIIDFSGFMGGEFEFTNDASAPFPMGDAPDENTTGKIMRFNVVLPFAEDGSEIPASLTSIERLDPLKASRVRYSTLVESTDIYQRLLLLLDNKMWDEAITQKPKLNTIEVWNLLNLTIDTHPIHLHLVQFQVLGRRPFDVTQYNLTKQIVYTGPEIEPDDNERGFKDTVRANPGEVTRIIARFGDFVGVYPWHCHILEHEDHDMMRPYEVVRKHSK